MAGSMMDYLFQKSLDDLVKGLRVQTIGEARYVSKAMEEIRKEMKSTDAHTKFVALQKMVYLNMLQGIDMSWASFHVVEVMSMPNFSYKKVGYLAATQSFHEGTDVLLLLVNLLRKDLGSKNEYEAGLALNCLSRIATPDLARDLTPEVFTMLTSSRAHLRRKATLLLSRVFLKYPDSKRVAFKRLVERLEDPDMQVVSAAVSVLCELASIDPREYLPLAPILCKLLMDSTNNWLCIKLVKFFGFLLPVEPRLGKKIVEPICEHMRRTDAKSLLYDCIKTVLSGLMDHAGAVSLAVEKLKELLSEDDPNLKYLGLQMLLGFMPRCPDVVADNKSMIMKCLNNDDPSIQMSALRLVIGMVSDGNLVETIQVLMKYIHSSERVFSNELISTVLSTCSNAFYELVTDFSWYVMVLADIARIPHSEHAHKVESQFIDIGLRVPSVRKELVKVARDFLIDPALLGCPYIHRVLSAAAWVAGEFVELSSNPYELIEALLQPRTKLLPVSIQAVYIHAVLKVFVFYGSAFLNKVNTSQVLENPHSVVNDISDSQLANSNAFLEESLPDRTIDDNNAGSSLQSTGERIKDIKLQEEVVNMVSVGTLIDANVIPSLEQVIELIMQNVSPLAKNADVEVQERATQLLSFIGLIEKVGESGKRAGNAVSHELEALNYFTALHGIFSFKMGPMSSQAQNRLKVPDSLELIDNLDELHSFISTDMLVEKAGSSAARQHGLVDKDKSIDSAALLAQHRQKHKSFYLPKDKADLLDVAQDDLYGEAQSQSAEQHVLEHTDEMLLWNKPRRPRARPVVVKLADETDTREPTISKVDLKNEVLSNAIKDVLDREKNRQQTTRTLKPPKHHSNVNKHGRKDACQIENLCDEVVNQDLSQSCEGDVMQLKSKERRRKPRRHAHTRHAEILNNVETREDEKVLSAERKIEIHKGKQPRNQHRHRARSPLRTAPQALTIPDFLL